MPKTLLDIFADLENLVKKFDEKAQELLLSRLQDSTVLVNRIDVDGKAKDLCTFLGLSDSDSERCQDKLRDLFNLDHDLTDADLALINSGCLIKEGDKSDWAARCREVQRKLSNFISGFQSEEVDHVYLVSAYFSIQINQTYDRSLGKVVRGEYRAGDQICGALDTFTLGPLGGAMRNALERLSGVFDKRDIQPLLTSYNQISFDVSALVDLFAQGNHVDFDFLDLLMRRYELDSHPENLASLLELYSHEEFVTRYRKYCALSVECKLLSARIEQLQRAIRMYDAFAMRNACMPPALQESELQRTRITLERKQIILRHFQQMIEQQVKPVTDDLEANPDYNPETNFCYAQMLLLQNALTTELATQVEYHLTLYVKEINHVADKITAYGILYILQLCLPTPRDKCQAHDKLPETLLQRALQLEEQQPQGACGFGYFIGMLDHIRQRHQIITDIVPMCSRAIRRGFNFQALIDQILLRGTLRECLFDVHIITHLQPIDPAVSKQYAYILRALICQEFGDYQLALSFLETQKETRFPDAGIRAAIACVFGRVTHDESMELFSRLLSPLEWERQRHPEWIKLDYTKISTSLTKIKEAKVDKNYSVVRFLNVVSRELNVIKQLNFKDKFIKIIIQNTVKQILDIINREYLIFSVSSRVLSPELTKSKESLMKVVPEVLAAYEELARPFLGIMEYCYSQRVAKFSDNPHGMFCHMDKAAAPAQ
jgi:hypothetical protein